ncbi:hypothetical protein EVG20_g3985 [Dentipellis fragilis]|uniref:Uncharacterized protein n=1 Tax=Dentipellis fragilis TaxID=205917 RepID=A0A4Y9YY47_9AGAM|nr:hypothetical protein EVG20_g3985 [Dentipellis fragilis]
MRKPDDSDASEEYTGTVLAPFNNELDRAIKSANAIQARINALSPLSRLPVEILVEIFRCSAAVQKPGSSPHGYARINGEMVPVSRDINLGWILVTHVCRRWRHVAIDYAMIWTHISFALGSEWTMRMIERSGQAPLVIREFGVERRFHPDIGEHLRPHLSHVLVFELRLQSYTLVEILSPMIDNAPMLHTLQLHSSTGEGELPMVRTQLDLFNQSTPSLQKIILRNVCIPWTSRLFSNLEYLEVALSIYEADEWFENDMGIEWEPTLPVFLDILQTMPGLKHLVLHDAAVPAATFIPVSPASNRNRTVSLPNLVDATLMSRPGDVAALLDHLELPRTTRFKFSSANDEHAADNVNLFASISRHLSRSGTGSSPITDLLVQDRMVSVIVTARIAMTGLDEADQTVFTISLPSNLERLSQTLSLFFSTIPFESLLSLSFVGGYHYVNAPCWRGIFQRLSSVRFLQTSMSGILPLLEHVHAGAEEAAPFPNLEVISIPNFWGSILSLDDVALLAIQEKIYDVLDSRKSRARVLQKLALWGEGPANLGTDWIARLQQLVSEITAQPPVRPGWSTN